MLLAVAGAGGLSARPAAAVSASTLTWSMISAPTTPPPLAYASMAYDSDNNSIVLFGGQRADGSLSSDTWVWNGSTWTPMASTVPERKLAAMAFDPALHQLILFGGQGANGQLLSDTWAWNGASWNAPTSPNPPTGPSPRRGASLAFDASDQLVLFGGSSAAVPSSAPATGSGSPAASGTPTPPPGGSAPTPASGAAGAPGAPKDPADSAMTLGDTWVWTGSAWSQQQVAGPPARTDAAAAWDGPHRQTVLFGGSANSAPSTALGDTWMWGTVAWAPSAPPSATSIRPTSRADTTLVADADLGGLVAFGGATSAGPVADTWLWNGQTWTSLAPTTSPVGRQGASSAYDVAAHQLLMFGGISSVGTVLGDTEILTTKAPISTETTPGPVGGEVRPPIPNTAPPGPTTSSPPAIATSPRGSSDRPAPGAAPSAPPPPAAREVRGGDLVTLSGTGFQPDTTVTITFHSTPYLVGRTLADNRGAFSATVAVPTTALSGKHHFAAVGVDAAGAVVTQVTPVMVAALSHPRAVAQTVVLVGIAIALPTGTWLGMGRRWRWRPHHDPVKV